MVSTSPDALTDSNMPRYSGAVKVALAAWLYEDEPVVAKGVEIAKLERLSSIKVCVWSDSEYSVV